jgi:hypothetical protein
MCRTQAEAAGLQASNGSHTEMQRVSAAGCASMHGLLSKLEQPCRLLH